MHLESASTSEAPQQGNVTGSAVAESEAFAYNEMARTQGADQQVADELDPRHQRHLRVEGKDDDLVCPVIPGELDPSFHGVDRGHVSPTAGNLGRMRIEGREDDGKSVAVAQPNGMPKQSRVSAVQPVKHSEGDHRALERHAFTVALVESMNAV